MSGKFAKAFSELEGDICGLTRMARLAECQLNEAVGGLTYENGECIEAPDAAAPELAVFTVTQMAVMAKRFEDLYYRLRKETGARSRAT
ncbi:hypothetical protein ACFFWD_15145 [Bradyrhizobium erythrophlei]|uniref:hypothetical protein n=1 Tax=Bradyrhizobium erythrophlei TaxID=1437360 RepID=UPI0035E642D7